MKKPAMLLLTAATVSIIGYLSINQKWFSKEPSGKSEFREEREKKKVKKAKKMNNKAAPPNNLTAGSRQKLFQIPRT